MVLVGGNFTGCVCAGIEIEAVAGFGELSASEITGGASFVCPMVKTEEAGG